jgi:hypothetical protein
MPIPACVQTYFWHVPWVHAAPPIAQLTAPPLQLSADMQVDRVMRPPTEAQQTSAPGHGLAGLHSLLAPESTRGVTWTSWPASGEGPLLV